MSNPRIGPAIPIRPTTPTTPHAAPSPAGTRFGELVAQHRAPAGTPSAASTAAVAPAASPASPARPPSGPGLTEIGRALLARVSRGERYVEGVVRQGLHGRAFTNEELLVMQAQVYRYTQELELVSKFVERATSTVKTVMQQNG